MSGKSGKVLSWAEVPDKKETYYSPQLLVHPDGSELILYGTGGETHGGSLWCLHLTDLMMGNTNKSKAIYTDEFKGVMTPPVLVDLTGDGVSDIVMAMFNSTVFAFNGLTFEEIWSTKFNSSETYSTPGIGYFNNDSIPDFIVNYQTGPGFPIYYFTQTTILNGRNGVPLMPEPVKMVVGTQSSPLVISSTDYGNDVFLYWVADCHGDYSNKELEFDFIEGTTIHEQSRSDFCRLRFRENLFTRLYSMTQVSGVPGTVVYDSDASKSQEFGHQLNYTEIGIKYISKNPKYLNAYYRYMQQDMSPVAEEDPRTQGSEKYRPERPKVFDHNIRGGMNRYPSERVPSSESDSRFGLADDERTRSENGAYGSSRGSGEDYGYQEEDGFGVDSSVNNGESWPPQEYNIYARKMPGQSDTRRNGRPRYHFPRWKRERKDNLEYDMKYKRVKRHVGPHDGGGIQRTISTGTLAPVIGSVDPKSHIDVVFATFWFYPAKTQALFPEDIRCIERRLAEEEEKKKVTSEYRHMNHEAYVDAVTGECLKKSGHLLEEATGGERYNPFDRRMGQMTVYRSRLSCQCGSSDGDMPCSDFLPFSQQGWPGYMGKEGNCIFNSRPDL